MQFIQTLFFCRLPVNDQFRLFKENVMLVLNLYIIRLLQSSTISFFINGDKSHSKANDGKLSLVQIFQSPWASNVNDEEAFESHVQKIQDLKFDETAFVLLTMVALTVPKGSFENLKAVDSLHADYVSLLKRHVTLSQHEQQNPCPLVINDVLNQLRQMADILIYKRILLTENSYFEKFLNVDNLNLLMNLSWKDETTIFVWTFLCPFYVGK